MSLWNYALCELDEDLVEAYASGIMNEKGRPAGRSVLFYMGLAACVVLAVFGASLLGKALHSKPGPSLTPTNAVPPAAPVVTELESEAETDTDISFDRQYMTTVLDPEYAAYHSARVCDPSFVGDLEKEITVEAGWKNSDYQYIDAVETLRAEVYSLKDVSPEIAVCLKFIDKGEALTTTHYYVYIHEDVPAEELTALIEMLGWNVKPDPGREENGTVIMTTSSQ